MILEHNRIILRPFEPKDAKDLYNITHDKAVQDYVPYAYCYSVDNALQNINDYYIKGDFIHDFYYVITLNAQVIGALVVTQNEVQEFEVSMIIGAEYRGKHHIVNALKAFIYSMPKGSKLVFYVKKENHSSINALRNFRLSLEDSESDDSFKYVYIV